MAAGHVCDQPLQMHCSHRLLAMCIQAGICLDIPLADDQGNDYSEFFTDVTGHAPANYGAIDGKGIFPGVYVTHAHTRTHIVNFAAAAAKLLEAYPSGVPSTYRCDDTTPRYLGKFTGKISSLFAWCMICE